MACWRCSIFGLAWIVVFYIAPDLKYMTDLGNWNLVIGMVFIAAGSFSPPAGVALLAAHGPA